MMASAAFNPSKRLCVHLLPQFVMGDDLKIMHIEGPSSKDIVVRGQGPCRRSTAIGLGRRNSSWELSTNYSRALALIDLSETRRQRMQMSYTKEVMVSVREPIHVSNWRLVESLSHIRWTSRTYSRAILCVRLLVLNSKCS